MDTLLHIASQIFTRLKLVPRPSTFRTNMGNILRVLCLIHLTGAATHRSVEVTTTSQQTVVSRHPIPSHSPPLLNHDRGMVTSVICSGLLQDLVVVEHIRPHLQCHQPEQLLHL